MKSNFPFEEEWISEKTSSRVFSESLEEDELKWHFDEEDRIIECVGETDWLFQFDDCLPQKIEGKIEIRKGVWHRLIKGEGDLKLLITRK